MSVPAAILVLVYGEPYEFASTPGCVFDGVFSADKNVGILVMAY